MAKEKVLRMTRVNISELVRNTGSAEDLEKLHEIYSEFCALMRIRTELRRKQILAESQAKQAMAEADKAEAQMIAAMTKFLEYASNYSNVVASEANWLPPMTNQNGDIILESPFTLRDSRNAMVAAHKEMMKLVDPEDLDIRFEGEED